MREVIFRGISIDKYPQSEERKGEFIYGDLGHGEAEDIYIRDREEDWCYDVNVETVGQYTGLHDKNGKEIYEGDILSFYDIHGVVKSGLHSDDVYNGWYVETASGLHCELNKSFSGAEVIGNIYENPELMEVSQ